MFTCNARMSLMFYFMLYLYVFCYLCMGQWPIVKQTFELEHDLQTTLSLRRNLRDQMSERLIKIVFYLYPQPFKM